MKEEESQEKLHKGKGIGNIWMTGVILKKKNTLPFGYHAASSAVRR